MNIDLIHNFWITRFTIHENKAPIEDCTPEPVIILLLKEGYPQIDISDASFLEKFTSYSMNTGLGLRRFTCRTLGNSVYYNVSRLHRDTDISLSMINTQGLIHGTTNKCNFLHGIITSMHAKHIIAITETHLTSQHGDGEITNAFDKYTVHRADRDTVIGRKTKCVGGDAAYLTWHTLHKRTGALL